MPSPTFLLVSARLCPFAQRCAILLGEKGVTYETQFVDLADKPSWFTELSPRGKVPLLKTGSVVLYESSAINEFLDETIAPPLLPLSPIERARTRAMVTLANDLNTDGYRWMTATNEHQARRARESAQRNLLGVERAVSREGWFDGTRLGLADAALLPALQRFVWLDHVDPSPDLLAEFPITAEYLQHGLAAKSVQRSLDSDIQRYFARYLQGKGSPANVRAPFWLGMQMAPSARDA